MTRESTTAATDRDPALDAFLSGVGAALAAGGLPDDASGAVRRIRGALATPGRRGSGAGRRLPVCDACLPEAYANARRHGPGISRVVDGFEAIEPRLAWAPRGAGGAHASANWPEGHANATVFGRGGLEERDDVLVGVSLLAPHVRYPDHDHAPEEVYLVLSPGRFQHGASGWFEPGIGGTLHNTPGLRHAMASDAAPLFAVWLLWTGRAAPGA